MTASDLTVGPARRGVLASAVGAAGAAALAGWTAGAPHPAANDPGPDPRLAAAGATRPFRGARLAGIADSPQTYAAGVALDRAVALRDGLFLDGLDRRAGAAVENEDLAALGRLDDRRDGAALAVG